MCSRVSQISSHEELIFSLDTMTLEKLVRKTQTDYFYALRSPNTNVLEQIIMLTGDSSLEELDRPEMVCPKSATLTPTIPWDDSCRETEKHQSSRPQIYIARVVPRR